MKLIEKLNVVENDDMNHSFIQMLLFMMKLFTPKVKLLIPNIIKFNFSQ